jgi:hypothetical protein
MSVKKEKKNRKLYMPLLSTYMYKKYRNPSGVIVMLEHEKGISMKIFRKLLCCIKYWKNESIVAEY